MGFELGPKLLRKAPRGWLPGRAFSQRHSVYSHGHGSGEGAAEIEMSLGMTVLWRVEVPDRAPYELEEERSVPLWVSSGGIANGNRWYKFRLRPSYGLMRDLGVPCRVNPGDPSEIWIDWDAAHDEHVPAWEREARVRREVERRKGGIDAALSRIGNPLTGRFRPEDEEHLQHALARERGFSPPPDPRQAGESAELKRRMDELARIVREGRKTTGTVIARDETDQALANVPLIVLTFEVEGRHVVFEHVFGPRHAKHYTVGRRVEVWVDPVNPDAIRPGR